MKEGKPAHAICPLIGLRGLGATELHAGLRKRIDDTRIDMFQDPKHETLHMVLKGLKRHKQEMMNICRDLVITPYAQH